MCNKPKSNVDPWINKTSFTDINIFNLFYCAIFVLFETGHVVQLKYITPYNNNAKFCGNWFSGPVQGCETVKEDSITMTKDGYTFRSEKLG